MLAEFKEIKELITQVLIKFPDARDDDNKLLAYCWFYLHPDIFDDKTGKEFLNTISSGLLVSPDTITRARRKIQANVPDLRGENYRKRKDRADEIRSKINKQGKLVL